jgi:hypothetical protein
MTLKESIPLWFEVMSILPSGVQASIAGIDYKVWMSLRKESLIIPPGDLLLKHGAGIAGVWNVIGILDAVPDAQHPITMYTSPGGPIMGMLTGFYPAARALYGRPSDAFGMTPILIYRKITR